MHEELAATIAGCIAARRRLEATVSSIDEEVVGRPSRLPGWTVGHVLAHLARNADSHIRMLDAALAGRPVEQYAGGYEQRSLEIEAGAERRAGELRADVRATSAALEAAWEGMTPEAWSRHGLVRGTEWPCRWLPFHRWREVEIHHVDLGLEYSSLHWPDEYVARELPLALATVPERVDAAGRAETLAWLVGRADQPSLDMAPWQADAGRYQTAPESLLADPRP